MRGFFVVVFLFVFLITEVQKSVTQIKKQCQGQHYNDSHSNLTKKNKVSAKKAYI